MTYECREDCERCHGSGYVTRWTPDYRSGMFWAMLQKCPNAKLRMPSARDQIEWGLNYIRNRYPATRW